ncbi:MAG TPA: hypothetical protein VMK42_12050 [Anaeromyxobacteraceae bacterium]|nr:hypothetical protein [Anaeromyxobacteraceae bacterium]
MTSGTTLPAPSVAMRGTVQRTFVPARLLAGFMDDNHLQQVAGEYLQSLDPRARAALSAETTKARQIVATLAPGQLDNVVLRQPPQESVGGAK